MRKDKYKMDDYEKFERNQMSSMDVVVHYGTPIVHFLTYLAIASITIAAIVFSWRYIIQ